jgi:hypothetical protein
MRQYNTITEIKEANKAIGHHWFSIGTKRFFDSKVESRVLYGQYFISSESLPGAKARQYSIRKALENGQIETVGEFLSFETKKDAIAVLKEMIVARGYF